MKDVKMSVSEIYRCFLYSGYNCSIRSGKNKYEFWFDWYKSFSPNSNGWYSWYVVFRPTEIIKFYEIDE